MAHRFWWRSRLQTRLARTTAITSAEALGQNSTDLGRRTRLLSLPFQSAWGTSCFTSYLKPHPLGLQEWHRRLFCVVLSCLAQKTFDPITSANLSGGPGPKRGLSSLPPAHSPPAAGSKGALLPQLQERKNQPHLSVS